MYNKQHLALWKITHAEMLTVDMKIGTFSMKNQLNMYYNDAKQMKSFFIGTYLFS